MKITSVVAAAVVAACSSSAFGVFTIIDGNAGMSSVLTPYLPDSNLPTSDFRADGLASPDHMFGYNWAYRAPGNGNRGFSWLDTPVQTVVGNTLTLVYTNAGPNPVGFNRFNARVVVKVFDTVIPNTARAECTVDFQAAPTNAGATVWNIFHIADLDLNATALNDIYAMNGPGFTSGTVTEGATTDKINFVAVGANRFEVNNGAALRNAVIGGGLTNLSNAVGPLGGDGAYGYQWLVTLQPGQTVQFKTGFGLNMVPLPPRCPADITGDNFVDVNDLVAFLGAFGTVVPPFTMGDMDGNGIVNVLDLTAFLAVFGTQC